MLGLNPFPRTDVEERENRRVTTEILGELYNTIDGLPGVGVCSGGAAFQAGATSTGIFANFPDGATSHWDQKVRIRPRWQRMGFKFRMLYSSSVASANNFSITVDLSAEKEGTVSTALLPSLWSTTIALPGPGVGGTEIVHEFIEPASVLSTFYEYLRIRITRNDPDANANDFRILGYRLTLFPA